MDIIFNKKIYICVENTFNDIQTSIKRIYSSTNVLSLGLNLIDTIVTGSCVLDEMIVDTKIEFGVFYASKFETTLYNVSDLSGKYIHVFERESDAIEEQTTGNSIILSEKNEELFSEDLHPIFTGRIDSCKHDKLNDDRKIIAYDPAYTIGQIDVADWYETFFKAHENDKVTLKQARESLVEYIGLKNPISALINDSLIVEKTMTLNNSSASAILKMMCELSCVFPHFSRTGELQYIQLGNGKFDLTNKYEWAASKFEDYVTNKITGVQFTDSDNEEKQIVGEYGNMYLIQKNIFLYSAKSSTLNTVGTNILNHIKTIQFTPADLKVIVGSLSYQVGNKITTPEGNFYVFANQLSGPLFVEQQLIATGDREISNISGTIDWLGAVFNEKYAKIRKDVDMYQQIYGDKLAGLESTFQQTAEQILLQVSNLETDVSSAIEVSAEAVRIASIGPKSSAEIITMINQNGDSEIKIHADQIEIEGSTVFKSLIDDSVTQIVGGNLITEVIYARDGTYSNITVDELKTSRKIKHYLNNNTIDDEYLYIHDKTIEFIEEKIILTSVNGAYVTNQAVNPNGQLLYWTKDISDATILDGIPYIDNAAVMMTVNETNWPVLTYQYEEPNVKANFSFNNSIPAVPVITLGAGDENGNKVGKIYKDTEGLKIEYITSNEDKRYIYLTEDSVEIHFDDYKNYINFKYDGFEILNTNSVTGDSVGLQLSQWVIPNSDITEPRLGLLHQVSSGTYMVYKICPTITVEERADDDYSEYANGVPTGTIIAVLEEEI